MQRFFCDLTRTGVFAGSMLTLPTDVVLMPQSWSASDRGGCKQATINASGSAESLAYLCGFLGDHIQISNDKGEVVWWGDLWDIDLSLGNVNISLSIENVLNRIRVTYPHSNPDGSEISQKTDWALDQNSIDRYGPRELTYGVSSALAASASKVRDQLINRLSAPDPILSVQGTSSYSAKLTAQGAWYKAAAVYFFNPLGLEEYTPSSGTQVIGRYLSNNTISFGESTEIAGQPKPEEDEMHIQSGTFVPLTDKDRFTISGAGMLPNPSDSDGEVGAPVTNDDSYTVDHSDSNQQIGISGRFYAQNAGPTIKVSYGAGIAMDNLAQSFTGVGGWTITHVALNVRQLNNPTDNFRIGIYPDNGGVPGVFLSAIEIPGATLFTEMTWMEFPLVTPVTLDSNATYWLGIRRTGTASLNDGYEVGVDENAVYSKGIMLVYNGLYWQNRDPIADLSFRLIGEIDSTEQIDLALKAVSSLWQRVIRVKSGIPVRQYRAEEDARAAMDEVTEMLDAGMSDGTRLISYVSPDGSIVVDKPQPSSLENLILGRNGKLRYPGGSIFMPGRLIYGQWIDIDSVYILQSIGARSSRGQSVYITGSSYDAASDTLSIESEGSLDPFSALKVRNG